MTTDIKAVKEGHANANAEEPAAGPAPPAPTERTFRPLYELDLESMQGREILVEQGSAEPEVRRGEWTDAGRPRPTCAVPMGEDVRVILRKRVPQPGGVSETIQESVTTRLERAKALVVEALIEAEREPFDRRAAWKAEFESALEMLRELAATRAEELSSVELATVALRAAARNYIELSNDETAWTLEHAAITYTLALEAERTAKDGG